MNLLLMIESIHGALEESTANFVVILGPFKPMSALVKKQHDLTVEYSLPYQKIWPALSDELETCHFISELFKRTMVVRYDVNPLDIFITFD